MTSQPMILEHGLELVKCVVVGDGGVGKTSLLMSFTTNSFPTEYVPTVFDNFSKTIEINEQKVVLGLWDTAGQEDYDTLRSLSYRDTNVFILCFSICDPNSYINVKTKWFNELKEHCPNVPIILVGLKEDSRIDHHLSNELITTDGTFVSVQEGEAMSKAIGAQKYLECSALTMKNVKNIFDEAATAVLFKEEPKKKKKCILL